MTAAQNVWSLAYQDALVLRDRNADNSTIGGVPTGNYGFAGSGLEERLYVQQDGNWNVTAVTNPSGVVQERYVYDPYGKATVLTGSWGSRSSSSYAWVYLHQGGRVDATTGLYHFRNRDYSPTLGRWMQQDPMGYVDGMSLYEYVGSGPTSRLDPEGTSWIDRILDWISSLWLRRAANFAAGVGDSLSLGLTSWIRAQLDVDAVNYDSGTYWSGVAVETSVECIITLGGSTLRKRATDFAGKTGRRLLEGGARKEFRKAIGQLKGGIVHHWNPIRQGRFPLPYEWAARGFWNMTHLGSAAAHTRAHKMLKYLEKLDLVREWTQPVRNAGNAIIRIVNEDGAEENANGRCPKAPSLTIQLNIETTVYDVSEDQALPGPSIPRRPNWIY